MLVAVYQGEWFTAAATEIVRVDPTRMAQGVMIANDAVVAFRIAPTGD